MAFVDHQLFKGSLSPEGVGLAKAFEARRFKHLELSSSSVFRAELGFSDNQGSYFGVPGITMPPLDL